MSAATAWCFPCKKNVEIHEPIERDTANKRRIVSGLCKDCLEHKKKETKISTFIKLLKKQEEQTEAEISPQEEKE